MLMKQAINKKQSETEVLIRFTLFGFVMISSFDSNGRELQPSFLL